MSTRAAPEGFPTLSPYLVTADAAGLRAFIARVLGGLPHGPEHRDGDRIAHSAMAIGDSVVMIGQSPDGGLVTAMLHVYVEDCDATFAAALDAGAEPLQPPMEKGDGDRRAGFRDPFGNQWYVATPTAPRTRPA